MVDEIFIDLNTHTRIHNIKDINDIVNIIDKTVTVGNIGTIVLRVITNGAIGADQHGWHGEIGDMQLWGYKY